MYLHRRQYASNFLKAIRDCVSVTWFGSVFKTEQVSGAKEYFRELVLASGWMKDLDEQRLVGGLVLVFLRACTGVGL